MRTQKTKTCQFVVFLLTSFLLFAANSRADSFSVDSWRLLAYVSDTTSGETQYQRFTTVQNPFVDQHSVSLPSDPATTTAAQYDISWLADYATVNIASQQQAHGLASDSVQTTASGFITLTTMEWLPLHITASLAYELPTAWMMAQLRLYVLDPADPSVTLFSEVQSVDTFSGQPASGIATITGDVLLPTNGEWRLQYAMELVAFYGTQGYSASGDGFVEFTITPEVSSLTMLAASSLLVLRRRTRRSC